MAASSCPIMLPTTPWHPSLADGTQVWVPAICGLVVFQWVSGHSRNIRLLNLKPGAYPLSFFNIRERIVHLSRLSLTLGLGDSEYAASWYLLVCWNSFRNRKCIQARSRRTNWLRILSKTCQSNHWSSLLGTLSPLVADVTAWAIPSVLWAAPGAAGARPI